MPTFIPQPKRIQAAGNKPKQIEEFIGRVNSQTDAVSIARMRSPAGWVEPGQTPEFDEYTVVLRGTLRVATKQEVIEVAAGQAIIMRAGEWVASEAVPPSDRPEPAAAVVSSASEIPDLRLAASVPTDFSQPARLRHCE